MNNQHKEDSFHYVRSASKRVIQILNKIIIPVQYVTKDILSLFISYRRILTIAVPTLRFISLRLGWIYGLSFVLDGISNLIDASREEKTNKSKLLLAQGLLLVIGGAAASILFFSNPIASSILLSIVWGTSAALLLYQAVNNYLYNRKIRIAQRTTLQDILTKIKQNNLKEIQPEALQALIQTTAQANNLVSYPADQLTQELLEHAARAQTIGGKGKGLEKYIPKAIEDLLGTNRFKPKVNYKILQTVTYVGISFLCALASLILFGKANITQSILIVHLSITLSTIVKNIYDCIKNPVLLKAQSANTSAQYMAETENHQITRDYLQRQLIDLKKEIESLPTATRNPKDIEEIIKKYGKIVSIIRRDEKCFCNFIKNYCDQINLTGNSNAVIPGIKNSIQARILYLESEHFCVLSRLYEQQKSHTANKPPIAPLRAQELPGGTEVEVKKMPTTQELEAVCARQLKLPTISPMQNN